MFVLVNCGLENIVPLEFLREPKSYKSSLGLFRRYLRELEESIVLLGGPELSPLGSWVFLVFINFAYNVSIQSCLLFLSS